ncbi:hypothetical protein NC651_020334 [Populus alba x Populus x berolinensis]|nr:hypothetical protein NC651_020334 [Populus alba x Populus x berolinensis]
MILVIEMCFSQEIEWTPSTSD